MAVSKLTPGLGIYTDDEFFDRPTCERLKAEMRAGVQARAEIYDRGWDRKLDEGKRSTLRVQVSPQARAFVEERMMERLPLLRRHFKLEATVCQEPTFLIYQPGDFFEPHQDLSPDERAPGHVRQRSISAIVFLSDEAAGDEPGEYAGGSLAFYGLFPDPRCERIGIPVRGRAGMLVAFRSGVFHQVTPVTRGERYTVVCWFS
jgi:predicted 2-oxoglutarate/Fe(II)-dependent dioxygenase YbiX